MSLIEQTGFGDPRTRAWYVVLVKRAGRPVEYTERLWLNNGEAIRMITGYPAGSILYEWNRNAWRDVSFPSRRAGDR